MNNPRVILGFLALAVLVPAGSANPPAADAHNGCAVNFVWPVSFPPLGFTVTGTLSYFAPLGTSIELCQNGAFGPATQEWGSHADPCPAGYVGPVAGAYCGPVIAAGGFAYCSWEPILNTVPTALVVGWDRNSDGYQNRYPTRVESVVQGPYPAYDPAWAAFNPHPVPARVIAFPTQTLLTDPIEPLGRFDQNAVICTT